jgi:bisphosphoglycerate-dependent phosphoglycerate mutase
MAYCKNYCEEERISTSKLNEAQKTMYYIAENMKMDKSISEEGYRHFQMAIEALEAWDNLFKSYEVLVDSITDLTATKATERIDKWCIEQLAEWLKELKMYREMIPSASEVFLAEIRKEKA